MSTVAASTIGVPLGQPTPLTLTDAAVSSLSTTSTRTMSTSPAPTADDNIKYGALFPYTIADVKISDNEDQPTLKGRRNVNTRLIGIGDIETINVDAKQLRNWGNREKMGLRSGNKSQHAVAIVNFVVQHRRMLETGRGDTGQPETIYARSKINYVRFINVCAHEEMKAKLINRGSQIGRAELDAGVQADEEMWKAFIVFYNGTDEPAFDELKYEVEWGAAIPDPSSFQPITWMKAQQAFKKMSSDYDMAHKKWKRSGWHEDFTQDFADYAGQKWLCYLHLFLEENPGILSSTDRMPSQFVYEAATENSCRSFVLLSYYCH